MTSAVRRLHATTRRNKKYDLAKAASATGSRVVCLPASAYCDELAGEMLAQLLRNQGFEAENLPARLKHEELSIAQLNFNPNASASLYSADKHRPGSTSGFSNSRAA